MLDRPRILAVVGQLVAGGVVPRPFERALYTFRGIGQAIDLDAIVAALNLA